MAKEITVLVGSPGCGKSTYAKDRSDLVRINQDSQGREGHLALFQEAFNRGDSICVDRMNFDKAQRDRYLAPAKAAGYHTEILVFEIPRKICYDRCIQRTDHETIKDASAANKALNFFFSHYEKPLLTEADEVIFTQYQTTKLPAIVIDLDGTLCDLSKRRQYVQRGQGIKPDWKKFFERIKNDAVNEPVAEVVRKFRNDYEIVYASGRPDDHRAATEQWLYNNDLYSDNLFMRVHGDFRPDDVVKEILWDFDILTQYDVLFALDDRDRVVKMLRGKGITVLQVADGDF